MAAITYKCPNCDGPLTWNGEKNAFVCDYCRGVFTEAELAALAPSESKAEEIDAEAVDAAAGKEDDEFLRDAVEQGQEAKPETKASKPAKMKVYMCPSCGAQVTAADTTAATTCFYCHNPIVLNDKFQEDLTPDYIIPFKIDRKKAEEIFTAWVQQHKYIPSAFYNKHQIELLSGVYFPYWVYDCTLHTDVVAKGTKVRTWDAAGMRHTETSVYDISNSGDAPVKNMSRIALNKASKVLCESVMPFDPSELKSFQAGYLQGYVAEVRDINKEDIKSEIAEELKSYADSTVRNSIGQGYSKVDIERMETSTSNEHYNYALMPVWTVTYKAKDGKIYYFSINGQSGKTCGELPVDNSKLTKLFLMVFIPAFVIIMLICWFLL